MILFRLLLAAAVVLSMPTGGRLDATAPAGGAAAAQNDLDDFMAQVIARRDENWRKLRQYVLDEREEMTVSGPSGAPLWGQARDYTWFIQDGVFVRSPLRVDGVRVPDEERRAYEQEIDNGPVQRQLRAAFANDANFLKMGDQQRQELAEGYILDFLVEHASLNAAVADGNTELLTRIGTAAALQFRQKFGVDLLSVKPGPDGFVASSQ